MTQDSEKASAAEKAAKALMDALIDLNRSENPLLNLVVLRPIQDAAQIRNLLQSLTSALKSQHEVEQPPAFSEARAVYTQDDLCRMLPFEDTSTMGHWDNPVAAMQHLHVVINEIRVTHPHDTENDLIRAVALANEAKAEYACTNGDLIHVLHYVRKKIDRYKAIRPRG